MVILTQSKNRFSYLELLHYFSNNYYTNEKIDKDKLNNFEDVCSNYIDKYFENGDKKFIIQPFQHTVPNSRKIHMTFTYVLGVAISQNTDLFGRILNQFDSFLPDVQQEYRNDNFFYYWFLTSLFHDYALSNIELPKVFKYDLFHYSKTIKMIISKLPNNTNYWDNINYSLKDTQKQYSNEHYKKYYNERNKYLKEHPEYGEFFEHGIYGGRIFFSNFMENMIRCIGESEIKLVNNSYFKKDFSDIIWFQGQIPIATTISYALMTHNIWKNTFESYGLTNFKKISLKNPILFLLCLVDALEMYKKLLSSYMLVKTEIEFKNEEKKDGRLSYQIIINIDRDCFGRSAEYIEYIESLKNMEHYIEVVVSTDLNNLQVIVEWDNV